MGAKLIFGDWWNALSGTEQVFWAIALVFSILFFIQFVLGLLGFDFDGDADIEVDGGHEFHADTDFTILSVRSFIAFFTFFGWAGVAVLSGKGTAMMAIVAGLVAGLAAMGVVGYVMYMVSRLQESGNVNIHEAIYKTGEVYLTIPAGRSGLGRIHISINGSLRELEAVTEGDVLRTGQSIRVLEVLDDGLVLVEPMKEIPEQL